MTSEGRRVLHWSPRVLSVMFALFLCGFTLVTRQIPAAVVLLILVLAWRWELAGSLLLALLAILCFVVAIIRNHAGWALLLSTPMLLIALLFLADWLKGARVDNTTGSR